MTTAPHVLTEVGPHEYEPTRGGFGACKVCFLPEADVEAEHVTRMCTHPRCRRDHPAFSLEHGDRVRKDYAEAVTIATRRAETRQRRQTIRRHHGSVFRSGVWLIQDARPHKARLR